MNCIRVSGLSSRSSTPLFSRSAPVRYTPAGNTSRPPPWADRASMAAWMEARRFSPVSGRTPRSGAYTVRSGMAGGEI